jgi:hypothetical protein
MNDQPLIENIKTMMTAKERRLVERAARQASRSMSSWSRVMLVEAARRQLERVES